jgi:hypothetical protein
MDKIDLTYDVVCRIEEQMNKRLEAVEKDVCELKDCKNKALGFIGCISVGGALVVEYIKNLLIR